MPKSLTNRNRVTNQAKITNRRETWKVEHVLAHPRVRSRKHRMWILHSQKNSAHLFLSTKMLVFKKYDLFEGTRFFLHSHNVVEKVGLKPCTQQTRPG